MTAQTPLHLQCRSLIGNRHLIDLAMTGRTTYAFVHMNAVIEISKVRQVVHSNPLDWFASTKALADWLQVRAVRPNLLMTVHAGGSSRKACRGSRFHGCVTVAAIDAVVADVMFVTKLDRLLTLNPLAGVPGRAIKLSRDPQQRDENKHGAIDRQLRERVGAVMKNLRHRENLSVLHYYLQISAQRDNSKA